jgi:1-acyl-sn-glycerol-3-phosphate acyltransferase
MATPCWSSSFELRGRATARHGSARRTRIRSKARVCRGIFAGPFLRRLGAVFVERHDISGSLADTNHAIAAAGQGRNIVFFPEGSFTRRASLSEILFGAFKVAAEAGLPVLPGVIRGTRLMLRSDQWFPRWAALSVKIDDAVAPSGKDFASLLRLCDATRLVVLAGCGEPDLEELVKPAPPSGSV